MKRLIINLYDKQHKNLKKLAFLDDKSISYLVRKAIDELIEKRESESADDEQIS